MTEQKHLIWSNYDLDYEDWRADLEAEYSRSCVCVAKMIQYKQLYQVFGGLSMAKKTLTGSLIVIVIVILACFAVVFRGVYINLSYYAMGGEVTIIAKQESNDSYYITVEQGKPDDAGWGQFELECTQEQYNSVDIGDVVRCDREQSVVTHKGTVHKIYE